MMNMAPVYVDIILCLGPWRSHLFLLDAATNGDAAKDQHNDLGLFPPLLTACQLYRRSIVLLELYFKTSNTRSKAVYKVFFHKMYTRYITNQKRYDIVHFFSFFFFFFIKKN